MALPLARHESGSYRTLRLTIAVTASVTASVLALQAESTWELSASPWFVVSLATVAAALRVEIHRR